MYNPRWPYTFSVVKESLDENGLPVTDEEGNPVEDEMALEKVIYDSQWNPTRGADGKFATESVTVMPWGYRTSTGGMRTSGEVIVADYKISCPMFLTELPTGTVLRMTDAVHTFRVKVIKMTTYNWGTNIWCDNILN